VGGKLGRRARELSTGARRNVTLTRHCVFTSSVDHREFAADRSVVVRLARMCAPSAGEVNTGEMNTCEMNTCEVNT
jgi:hypothetical protein